MNDNYPMIDMRSRIDEEEDTIDLLELGMFLSSKIKMIILFFVMGALIAGSITKFLITPTYTATSKMYMVSSSSNSVVDLTDLNLGTSLSSDYEELLIIHPIIDSVIDKLKLDYKYKDMLEMLEISTITDTRILTISVTSPDPKEAADIANALASEAKNQLPKLMDTPAPTIAENALVPTEKSAPSTTKNTLLGALALTVLILAIYTVQFLMDDTVRSPEDIEKYFGIMPFTVIPEEHIEGFISHEEEKDKRKRKTKSKKAKKGGK